MDMYSQSLHLDKRICGKIYLENKRCLSTGARIILIKSIKMFVNKEGLIKPILFKEDFSHFVKLSKIKPENRTKLSFVLERNEAKIISNLASVNRMNTHEFIRTMFFYYFAVPNPEQAEQVAIDFYNSIFSEQEIANSANNRVLLDAI